MTAAAADLQHPIGPTTVEDWLALDPPADGSRLELIYGYLHGYLHATPAPSGEHQYAAFRLSRLLEDAIRSVGRTDLCVVPAVNVRISTAWRTVLIPDVTVLSTRPIGSSFPADAVALAVEIWSPGNPRAERETKKAACAAASVPFLWTITQDQLRGPALTAYRLKDSQYVEEIVIDAGGTVMIMAAPVPVTLNLAELIP